MNQIWQIKNLRRMKLKNKKILKDETKKLV